MKRINNNYSEICELENIHYIYNRQIRINCKNKRKVEKFEDYYVENIINIKEILEQRKYKSENYRIAMLTSPKYRIIMSQSIKDKTINHLVANCILKCLDSTLINENIATRKDKGTHYGLRILSNYLNQSKNNYKNFYVLKCDIKKYFYNIDHKVLLQKIEKKIKDKDSLNIIKEIINSTNQKYINQSIKYLKSFEINKLNKLNNKDSLKKIKDIEKIPLYEKNKGVPIGNMTSQIFAIYYLNDLDHYIKEVLHIKYYLRYMDDFILIHHDKEYLKYCLNEIKNKLLIEFKLELNSKTNIINIKNGLDFLGFHYYIRDEKIIKKVRTQTKRKFKYKIKKMIKLYNQNKIALYDLKQIMASYKGHLKFGNSYKLIKNIEDKYHNILG